MRYVLFALFIALLIGGFFAIDYFACKAWRDEVGPPRKP